MKRILLVIFCSISLISCSPLYVLFIQNNTNRPLEVYVELKNEEYTQSFKKVIEKREVYNYKKSNNIDELDVDSIRYYLQANKFSEKKYNFTSKFNYNFILAPQLLTIVDPSNGISIYPFEKVYYIQDEKKCFIVPKADNQECSFKTINKRKLKKDKKVKAYFDFIIIENSK